MFAITVNLLDIQTDHEILLSLEFILEGLLKHYIYYLRKS